MSTHDVEVTGLDNEIEQWLKETYLPALSMEKTDIKQVFIQSFSIIF